MNIKQLGLSTSAFAYNMGSIGKGTPRQNPEPWTLEQFIEFANKLGFGGVEAPLKRFVPDLEPARLKAIKSKLDLYKMFFIMDAEGALDVAEIIALMPLAAEFGSSIIRIKSSNVLSCDRKSIGYPWKEHVEHCIKVLQELKPELQKRGVRIAIENHQDLDSSDLKQIIEAVGADVVGVNFDIGNAFSTCEDPIAFANKLGSSIINIHLKDYRIFQSKEGFRLVRCPLGAGSVGFEEVLAILANSSPNAKMVVELGALQARNIAQLGPTFWEEIQPRSEVEKKAFEDTLERSIIRTDDNSWQTPWEKGGARGELADYEIEGLKSSLDYLATLFS